MNPKTISIGTILASLSLTTALTAFGGEAVLNRNDGNAATTSFNGLATSWTPNVAPNSTEGAATDFIVKNGLVMRTPDGDKTETFKGRSLTLGASDRSSAGGIVYKSNGCCITLPNLTVHRGYIASGCSFCKTYNTWCAGNATLYTTPDDPFRFAYDTRISRDAVIELQLTGDESTAIRLEGATASKILPHRDQSATYAGSWSFGPNQYLYVWGGFTYTSGGATIRPMNGPNSCFGKPLTAFNPKSIFFDDGCTLRYEPWSETANGNASATKRLLASDRRGITLADNATLNVRIVNAYVFDCGYPFASNGGTVKVLANGTFRLRANATCSFETCDTTTLALVGNIAVTGRVTAASGRAVAIGEAATDRVSVAGDITLSAGGGLTFAVASDGSDAAQLHLAGDLASDGPIGIGFSATPSVAAEREIPVLVIDKSVSRVFTADDFDPCGVGGAQIANARGVTVARNGDGDQVVAVRVFPFVRSNRGYNTRAYFKNANEWTPNGVVSAGHNYIGWNNPVQTGEPDGKTVVAPGDQWVFYNLAPTETDVYFISKEAKMTFSALRLLDNTGFRTAQRSTGWTMEWAGAYDIHTTTDGYAYFNNAGMAGAIVSATLTGRGRVLAVGISGDSFDYHMTFSGDNAGYRGTFAATNQTAGATARPFTLRAAREENFGGNPEVFSSDAWRLGSRVAFAPTAAITIDDANRGVTFEDGSIVETAAGCDFSVLTPVVAEGGLTKRGAGLFAYGAGGFTPPSAAWTLAVEGGSIKPQHANALKGASVTFAAGTALELDAVPPSGWGATGLDLTTASLTARGERVGVRFNCAGVTTETRVPVATFASAAEAEDALALLSLERAKGYRVTLAVEGASIRATLAKSGFAVIVR